VYLIDKLFYTCQNWIVVSVMWYKDLATGWYSYIRYGMCNYKLHLFPKGIHRGIP